MITAPRVRLIGPAGENIGVVPIDEARRIADDNDQDLVEIVPNADPPVCRVMDIGKFIFEQNKKRHAARRKQKQIQIKEIKIRPTTEEGDYQVKLRSMTRFLEDGDKVKVTLRFRGRELMHQEFGVQMLKRIETDLASLSMVEQHPRLEGKQMVMLLAPRRGGGHGGAEREEKRVEN